jgi:hypothetical protein
MGSGMTEAFGNASDTIRQNNLQDYMVGLNNRREDRADRELSMKEKVMGAKDDSSRLKAAGEYINTFKIIAEKMTSGDSLINA